MKENNNWSRGFTITEFLILILNRKVTKFDIIWHTGLCPLDKSTPYDCIHPSIQAREIHYIPNWIFKDYFGIPDLFRKVKKKWKRIFKKNDSLDKFNEAPVKLEKLLERAIVKNILPSIRAIHNLSSGGKYSVDLTYIKRKQGVITETYQAVIQETESNQMKFQILLPHIPNVGGVLYKKSYGLDNQLYLENKNGRLRVLPNSVSDFSTEFPYEPQILQGRFTQINQVVPSNYADVYLRLIVPVSDKKVKTPSSILERSGSLIFDNEEFNVTDTVMGISFRTGAGFSEIEVNGKRYHYYFAKKIFILECLDKNDLDSFKLETEQIRLAFAFLCGNLYREEAYYLSSNSSDFKEIEGVWYEKEPNSIITINQIVNPQFFFQDFRDRNEEYQGKYGKFHELFSTKLFSKLCDTMLSEDKIQRAIKLLVDGSGNADAIQQGALYSVAIETLTGYLAGKNDDKLKPIQNNETSEKILKELTDVLLSNSGAIGEDGLEILKKKIKALNNPTNIDKLTETFKIYGFALTEANRTTISKRNKYLHGSSPLKTKEQFKLNKLALELHYLAGCLILKFIGYEGHVMNLPLWMILNNQEKFIELSKSNMQKMKKLLKELQKALARKDEEKIRELKSSLEKAFDTDEMRNMIEII